MAMGVEQVTCLLCVFLALLLPRLLHKLWKGGETGVTNLPPSPWRLPVIGNLHQVMSRGPLLHRALADLARRLQAPLMYLQLGEVPVVVASSPEAAREITKTHDLSFANRPWSPSVRVMVADGDAQGLVFARYGALWRLIRKTCVLELLSARRVRSFCHIREEEARRLVAAIAAAVMPGEATVDVGERISAAMTDSMVRAVIGDRFDRTEEFLEVFKEGRKLAADKASLADLFPSSWIASLLSSSVRRAEVNHRKMFELMDSVIRQHQERRAAGGNVEEEEDMVDVLLRLQKEDHLVEPLTMGTIKAVLRDLFSAGSETALIEWAMAQLMRNPRVMQKVQAELRESLQGRLTVTEDDLINVSYLKLVIKETMRLNNAVPLLEPRECREACKVMGYDVPKGTTVFVNAWTIGRDPKYWGADAEDFIPERFDSSTVDFNGTDFEFLPFGAGRRMCPGMALGLASNEIVLASLLYHFDWELPAGVSPSEMDMTEEMGVAMTSRMKNGLHLRPIVRVPLQAAP